MVLFLFNILLPYLSSFNYLFFLSFFFHFVSSSAFLRLDSVPPSIFVDLSAHQTVCLHLFFHLVPLAVFLLPLDREIPSFLSLFSLFLSQSSLIPPWILLLSGLSFLFSLFPCLCLPISSFSLPTLALHSSQSNFSVAKVRAVPLGRCASSSLFPTCRCCLNIQESLRAGGKFLNAFAKRFREVTSAGAVRAWGTVPSRWRGKILFVKHRESHSFSFLLP